MLVYISIVVFIVIFISIALSQWSSKSEWQHYNFPILLWGLLLPLILGSGNLHRAVRLADENKHQELIQISRNSCILYLFSIVYLMVSCYTTIKANFDQQSFQFLAAVCVFYLCNLIGIAGYSYKIYAQSLQLKFGPSNLQGINVARIYADFMAILWAYLALILYAFA